MHLHSLQCNYGQWAVVERSTKSLPMIIEVESLPDIINADSENVFQMSLLYYHSNNVTANYFVYIFRYSYNIYFVMKWTGV